MDEIEVVEVGEYIRTDDGIIAKVNNIDELRIDIPTDRAVYRIWVDDYYGNHKEDRFIKSHSKNIIDLIEVGDYVNRERVTFITNSKIKEKKIITEYDTDFFEKYEKIETIVTKEQFESIEYKIGE